VAIPTLGERPTPLSPEDIADRRTRAGGRAENTIQAPGRSANAARETAGPRNRADARIPTGVARRDRRALNRKRCPGLVRYRRNSPRCKSDATDRRCGRYRRAQTHARRLSEGSQWTRPGWWRVSGCESGSCLHGAWGPNRVPESALRGRPDQTRRRPVLSGPSILFGPRSRRMRGGRRSIEHHCILRGLQALVANMNGVVASRRRLLGHERR